MSAPELEPIGHLKFGAAGGDKPITADINTFAEWCKQSRHEYQLHHYAVSVLNVDDKALEKMMRSGNDGEETVGLFLDMADDCQHWIGKYKAGIEVLNSVCGRILIVAERISDEDDYAGDTP